MLSCRFFLFWLELTVLSVIIFWLMINDEKCENAETIAEINAADLDDVLAGRNAYFLSVFTA